MVFFTDGFLLYAELTFKFFLILFLQNSHLVIIPFYNISNALEVLQIERIVISFTIISSIIYLVPIVSTRHFSDTRTSDVVDVINRLGSPSRKNNHLIITNME